MNTMLNRTGIVIAGLMLAMAATRFNHFGSAVTLPDASLAVFFLGGMYLAGYARALWVFAALLIEAVLIDCYAIELQGVSDWCVTPAYGFLLFAYAVMWLAGRWFAPKQAKTLNSQMILLGVASGASAAAFVISNVSFFLFSGRYADMSAAEYTSRVAQYFVPYVGVALLYIACAVAVQMIAAALSDKSKRSTHPV